ncbi:MAG: hypothetical protein ABR881_26930 [Candidatus Sulfotelmatobacter sp.]|jgi:hypothetical protein
MALGIDSFSGVAEKVSNVPFPVLMRVGLPGLLAAFFAYPLALPFSHLNADFTHHWINLLVFLAMILVFGVILSAISGEVYKLYEGRSGWPKPWRDRCIARQNRRAAKMFQEMRAATDPARYDELSYRLRDYPQDPDGTPQAKMPTILGNLLYQYEHYPEERYGMDAVFYWTRIWMVMDKDVKKEIDDQWSVADGFLSLSLVSFAGGLLWTLVGLLSWFDVAYTRLPTDSNLTIVAGLFSLLMGYVFYRASLPFHRQNGERFRAIFDVYRDKIKKMMSLKPNERSAWKAAWAYYQYGLLYCEKCGKFVSASDASCASCHADLNDERSRFRESGIFPPGPD